MGANGIKVRQARGQSSRGPLQPWLTKVLGRAWGLSIPSQPFVRGVAGRYGPWPKTDRVGIRSASSRGKRERGEGMAIGRCREETAKGSQRAEAPRGGRDRTMWNTDFNLATVVKKDQELWERELNQVQRIGGFEIGRASCRERG